MVAAKRRRPAEVTVRRLERPRRNRLPATEETHLRKVRIMAAHHSPDLADDERTSHLRE